MKRTGPLLTTTIVLANVACSAQSPPMVHGTNIETNDLTSAAAGLAWVGDTHLRYDGRRIPAHLVMGGRGLDVYTQTWPAGTASTVTLFWQTGGGVSSRSMSVDVGQAGPSGHNTQWRTTIPAEQLVDGRPLTYWLRAEDESGVVVWDSRFGQNYEIVPHDEVTLFDGTSNDWKMAGGGSFALTTDGEPFPTMVAKPADGLGLYWSTFPIPPSFELSLEFRLSAADDNSGVFLRFPDPDSLGYDNAAWVGVHYGLEVQIDETARPDGAGVHRTGAFYEVAGQALDQRNTKPVGEWNSYVIRVVGQTYSVSLDGHEVSRLVWGGDPSQPLRALPGSIESPRFIGVQSHTGAVAFRNIRLKRF